MQPSAPERAISHGLELPISVVIPAFRRADLVERAVRSALAQTRRAAEVVVVDDCSGDDTGPRAAALGARVITHERNLGEGGARNSGLKAAAHDWVALLDSDDEWLPDHLATLWAARDGHVLLGTAMLGSGTPAAHRTYGWGGPRPLELRGPADVAVPENRLTASSVLLRRDAALAAGGFRTGLARASDLDLWVRMLERGSALAIPRITALYHMHEGQISSDREPMREAHLNVLAAYAGRPWCSGSVRRRHEGAVAWDRARAEVGAGARIRALAGLAGPWQLVGVVQLLYGRFWGRRLAARRADGGGPSLAIMPGVEGSAIPGARDLRAHTTAGALIRLAHRPAAEALVSRRAQALALRGLGVRALRATRARAAAAR